MSKWKEHYSRPSDTIPGKGTQGMRMPGPTCPTRNPGITRKVEYVKDAFIRASMLYIDKAIIKHTTEDFWKILEGLIPALMIAAGAVVVTTLIGAGIGALFGGVGAIPGAFIGAKVGLAILSYLGLAFLAAYVLDHISEVGEHLHKGVSLAWDSCGSRLQIDQGAREIAEGIGVLCSLIIQAILVYLLRSGSKGMTKLRQSKLFKWCPRLDSWIRENFIRLCFRYKIKGGIPVISGGRIGAAKFSQSLVLARSLLGDMMSGNHPRFRTFRDLHRYLTSQKGLRVAKKEVYGPREPATGKVMTDAAQVIYSSADGTVVVKVKTRGYEWGGRKNGTMSIEITDGGPGWEGVRCKISRDGQIIAKTRLAEKEVVVLKDGVYAITKGAQKKLADGAKMDELSKGGFGSDLRKVIEFEMLEGGGVKPMSQDAFANQGHIDFAEGFNSEGAWDILKLESKKVKD
ncbi:MAG: DUF6861 domain-containing protein [bacterium]